MTTYYGLYGQKVQYLASDPTDVQICQVWYNSTSATLKVRSATTSGTWASAASAVPGNRRGSCQRTAPQARGAHPNFPLPGRRCGP